MKCWRAGSPKGTSVRFTPAGEWRAGAGRFGRVRCGQDEGLTTEELDRVTRWRRTIAHVATEE